MPGGSFTPGIEPRPTYTPVFAPLERYFATWVFEKGDVDDLVQEVFTRLLARSERVQMEEPEAYVFQIAANLLRDRSRRDIVRKIGHGASPKKNGDLFRQSRPSASYWPSNRLRS